MVRQRTVAAAALALLTLALLFPAFRWLVLENWLPAPGSSIGLIPLVTGLLWLGWGWRHIPNRAPRRPAGGMALLAGGLWWWLAAWAAEASVLQGAALPWLVGGLIWLYGGEEKLKRLIFPIAYLWLVFPPPGLAEHWFSFPLRLWSARLAFVFMSILGLPGELQGTSIVGPDLSFDVAPACSGLRTVYTFLIAGVLVARLMHDRWLWLALQIATIPLATLLANSLRITSIAWMGRHFGPDAAIGLAHETVGVFFFLAVFSGFMALGLRLSRRHPVAASTEHPEKATPARLIAPGPRAGPSWVLLGMHAGLLLFTSLFLLAIRDNRLAALTAETPPLSYSLDGWAGRDVPLTSAEADLLGTSRMVKRLYAQNDRVVELIVSTSLPDRRLLHDPTGCYVAVGKRIVKRWTTSLAAGEGRAPLEVGELLVAGPEDAGRGGGLRCRFWFVREDGLNLCRGYDLVWVTLWERLRLRPQKPWRLFSLATPVKPGEEERVRQSLDDFTWAVWQSTTKLSRSRSKAGS